MTIRTLQALVLLFQKKLPVPAKMRIPGYDSILTFFGAEDMERGESYFRNVAKRLLTILKEATSSSLIIMDELHGSDYWELSALQAAIMKYFDKVGATVVLNTHMREGLRVAGDLDSIKFLKTDVTRTRSGKIIYYYSISEDPNLEAKSYGIETEYLTEGQSRRALELREKLSSSTASGKNGQSSSPGSQVKSASSPVGEKRLSRELVIEYLRRSRDKYEKIKTKTIYDLSKLSLCFWTERIELVKTPQGYIFFFAPHAKEIYARRRKGTVRKEIENSPYDKLVLAISYDGKKISQKRKSEAEAIRSLIEDIAGKFGKTIQLELLPEGIEFESERIFTPEEEELIGREIEYFARCSLPNLSADEIKRLIPKAYLRGMPGSTIQLDEVGNPVVHLFVRGPWSMLHDHLFHEFYHYFEKLGYLSTLYLATSVGILRKVELYGIESLTDKEIFWFSKGVEIASKIKDSTRRKRRLFISAFLRNTFEDWIIIVFFPLIWLGTNISEAIVYLVKSKSPFKKRILDTLWILRTHELGCHYRYGTGIAGIAYQRAQEVGRFDAAWEYLLALATKRKPTTKKESSKSGVVFTTNRETSSSPVGGSSSSPVGDKELSRTLVPVEGFRVMCEERITIDEAIDEACLTTLASILAKIKKQYPDAVRNFIETQGELVIRREAEEEEEKVVISIPYQLLKAVADAQEAKPEEGDSETATKTKENLHRWILSRLMRYYIRTSIKESYSLIKMGNLDGAEEFVNKTRGAFVEYLKDYPDDENVQNEAPSLIRVHHALAIELIKKRERDREEAFLYKAEAFVTMGYHIFKDHLKIKMVRRQHSIIIFTFIRLIYGYRKKEAKIKELYERFKEEVEAGDQNSVALLMLAFLSLLRLQPKQASEYAIPLRKRYLTRVTYNIVEHIIVAAEIMNAFDAAENSDILKGIRGETQLPEYYPYSFKICVKGAIDKYYRRRKAELEESEVRVVEAKQVTVPKEVSKGIGPFEKVPMGGPVPLRKKSKRPKRVKKEKPKHDIGTRMEELKKALDSKDLDSKDWKEVERLVAILKPKFEKRKSQQETVEQIKALGNLLNRAKRTLSPPRTEESWPQKS